MQTGRNDPCPCGSGLKYKKCCLDNQQTAARPESEGVFDEIRQALQGRAFSSLEEANVFLAGHMRQKNQAARDDFDGLSPEQMHRFLYFPFDSPEIVIFPQTLPEEPAAPILTLFALLAAAIGEEGLRPTATGNLPRNFCREAALAYWGEEKFRERTRYGNINKEDDFGDLHVARLVAELAGLVRKYRGKFILSRDCRRILAEKGMAGIYPRLLRAYTREFNWGYRDRYPELGFIQQSFLFTLYLLHRHGGDWMPHVFYEDRFLRAFPMLLNEVPPEHYVTPEEQVRSCYTLRTLEHFITFLGLAEVKPTGGSGFSREFRVKKLPLLNAAVKFNL